MSQNLNRKFEPLTDLFLESKAKNEFFSQLGSRSIWVNGVWYTIIGSSSRYSSLKGMTIEKKMWSFMPLSLLKTIPIPAYGRLYVPGKGVLYCFENADSEK